MCGIAAIVRAKGLYEHERGPTLTRMRDALAHRGPDDATLQQVDEWVGLGFRRLSIIDIEGARQPLWNETGEIGCIFNGEIYNFQSLRERLIALGHRFSTRGDGEVIVHGYEQWGAEIAAMLEGMFAFILVDRTRDVVIAARDRFGIKPLFWTRVPGAVLLGSELKALLAHPETQRVANRLALELGSLRMHVPWPLTAFAGFFRLPPGALMQISRTGEVSLRRHSWMVKATPAASDAKQPLVERACSELEEVVRRQMVADVPVGAFLSGGIDSSIVVALMSRIAKEPVHTFSIRTPLHDESEAAAETARRLGTKHHPVEMRDLPLDDMLALPSLYDEPFAETSALGVRLLSIAAREHVKVALSGDGGDEIFGGYDEYRWLRHTSAMHLNGSLGRRVHEGARRLLEKQRWPPPIRRGLRALVMISADQRFAHRELAWPQWSTESSVRETSEHLSALVDELAADQIMRMGPARQAMAVDRLERLPDAMLCKVDIASMAASLEVRVPMLDDALVRFADTVHERELIGLRKGKLLLRRVLERLLPGGLAWRKKQGFTLPLELWMRSGRTSAQIGSLLSAERANLRRLTGVDAYLKWRMFQSNRTDISTDTAARQLLWFMTVAEWARRFRISDVAHANLDPVRLEQQAV